MDDLDVSGLSDRYPVHPERLFRTVPTVVESDYIQSGKKAVGECENEIFGPFLW